MKKVLLSLAAVGVTMSANAQLLNYGFETSDILPGQMVTENWSDGTVDHKFANCTFELAQAGSGIGGSNALWVYTDVAANPWERVVAFTNTGIAENKSYRISLWVKGDGDFNVALLKGCFNHDQALQAGNGSTYVDQTKTFTANDGAEFVRYSYVVWSPSREVMTAKKGDFADDEYWNQDFLRLAFTGIGSYTVDDVKIEESTVQNIAFNQNVIRVDFGYATNAAELAEANGGAIVLDNSVVSVKANGEPVEVSSVEIKDGGQFFIFLNEYLDSDAEVTVSFNNPGNLTYSTNVAPESWTNPNAAVYNFTDEVAYVDEELFATSIEWEEASLVTSSPQNDSFEWEGTIDNFTFTFNKPVWTNAPENGKPIATLVGPGVEEDLQVVEFDGCQPTLTFKRPAGSAALADGMYTISVDNVSNEKDVATTTPFVISFETGFVEMGTVEYTDFASVWMEGEYNTAQPTNGWISYFNGEENSSNANRVGNMVTDGKGVGFYFCQRDGSVAAKLTLGEKEEFPFTLPAGNVQITFFATKWQGAGGTYSYKLVKKDNPEEVVASGDIASEGNTGNFGETVTAIPGAAVKIPDMVAGDYILTLETAAAWSGTIVYGVDIKTYKESGGPKAEPEVLINESFASVENGKVPAAGSGWAVYDNNNIATKGESQSGRNRMMSTGSCSNLSIGFYNRCFGTPETYYLTYGEPAPEGQEEEEPKFILENAKYSFSWYAVNWKGDEQTYYFQLINAETGEVEYEMTPVKVTANVNGGAQSADAVQILFNYIPQGGQYIMKWWMTGEAIIGKIRVEKMGSLAVYWKSRLINDGLTKALEERENAAADEYAGTTRDNLDAVIAKNSDPSASGYHTPDDYQTGIDECLAAAKAMATRRDALAKFKSDIEKLATALEEIDAKYERLEIIPELKELVATYGNVDPSTLEDEELLPVQAKITAGVSAVTDVINAVNNLITKQIHNLLDAIAVYGEKLDDEFSLAWINKGQEALTDDQTVATVLQQILTACIYDSIANGYDFTYFDADSELNFADSIDITGYIANNMFYTVNPQKNYEASEANAAFPGWNITEGTVSNVWWWEGTLAISANKPAVDASIRNIGSNAFKVNQALSNLPVGIYTMIMKTADCSNVADVSTTYVKKDESLPWSTSEVYAQVGENVASVEANYGQGQTWRGAADTYLPNIQGTVAAGENTVAMTIGANINCTNDAAQVDDTRLFLTGKIDGFDYRAAAAAIRQQVAAGLKAVERTDAPIAVQYYNLAGQKGAAQGVNIKVERYSDGYTVVKKVIVK